MTQALAQTDERAEREREVSLSLSERLERARADVAVTYTELAEACGYARNTAVRWEEGAASSIRDVSTLLKIAEVLGVSPAWLILGDDYDRLTGQLSRIRREVSGASAFPLFGGQG